MSSDLPPHLEERSTRLMGPLRPDGVQVVYWMRTAVRGHDNPALDVAIAVSRATNRPLLVYHGVSERYPYASDRHHTFLLQGARDVSAELAERGIPYALHVERPGQRGPHLRTLAREAVVVVTEDMPVAPLAGWTARLAEEAPVWTVDTACVVPMPLVGRAYTRAYAYRDATVPLRAGRLDRVWRDETYAGSPALPALPFEPVDASEMDIPELVAACDIDHAVGPVPETRGGSRAGYRRWDAFLAGGLRSYAGRRNDAADPHGVSRMSPYLHMGFVSPFRLAREVAATSGRGAEKFLEELLTWRELAHAYCRFVPEHETVEALPSWARATLAEHEGDARPALPDAETLSRALTGDRLWDTAQRSLLVHGELHNNLRMTWGKALLGWTPDASTALRRLIDLNHRYALDGRDPASYVGILWCLGGLDRPFSPEVPILGAVRPRDLGAHARRLDLDRYERHVRRPLRAAPPRTAVIGGGMAGLSAARVLVDHGYEVVVFDKGRGPGGRMSTRRREGATFDHGAQYFTARDPRFVRAVEAWEVRGVVGRWSPRLATIGPKGVEPFAPADPRWVGTPSMSRVARHLAQDLPVRFGVRVGRIERGDAWVLTDERDHDLGTYDAVVIAVPAPQAVPLLLDSPALADAASAAEMAPCWAAMLTLDAAAPLDFDAARVLLGPLRWMARDSSKPGRPAGERWVVHASPEWSETHLEDEPASVADALLGAFRALVGQVSAEVVVHRWRHALVSASVDDRWDPRGLVLAGDWVAGGGVEGAFVSGQAAAGRLLGHFAATAPALSPDQPSLFG